MSTENSGACSAGTFCTVQMGAPGCKMRFAGSVACRSKDIIFQISPNTNYSLVANQISFLVSGYNTGIAIQVEYTPNNGSNYYTLGTFSGGAASTTVPLANGTLVSYSLTANNTCSAGTAGTFLLRLEPYFTQGGSASYLTFGSVLMSGTVQTLPVEMTTYSATVNGQTVTLNWATATEVQNSGWDIERSNGNSQWTKIGFVQGSGNSNSPHQYSYVDKSIKQNGEYTYRLKQIDDNGTTVYTREVEAVINVPLTYALNQNYPNPFNPSTTISYEIPTSSKVTIKIYNILGDEVTTLVNGNQEAGRYQVIFDASRYSSGVYFYSITAGNFVQTKKMILLK
jgi:hypothetical protein